VDDPVGGDEAISFDKRADAVGLRVDGPTRQLPDVSPEVLRVVRRGGNTHWVWICVGSFAVVAVIELARGGGLSGLVAQSGYYAAGIAILATCMGCWFHINGRRTASAIQRSPEARRCLAYVPMLSARPLSAPCTVVADEPLAVPITFNLVHPPSRRIQGKPFEAVLLGHPAPGERLALVLPHSRMLVASTSAQRARWPPPGWQFQR
jgi:hypothetical protein